MAELFVRHSLNNKKAVKILVSFRYFVDKASGGDHIWTLELGTTELNTNGERINPIRVNNIDVKDIDNLISESIADIAVQIDWSPFVADTEPPVIFFANPIGDNVSIGRNIIIKANDDLPSSGIDLSGLNIFLDIGDTVFNITSEFVVIGDPYEYTLEWAPKMRVNNTYE